MNKLSIFLSMLVAVTVAAFAASEVVTSGLSTKATTTQGYWFTLSRSMKGTQTDPTAGAQGEMRYITIGGAAVSNTTPSTTTGDLANNFFWTMEEAPEEIGGKYLRNNTTNRYLSAEKYSFINKDNENATEWGYRLVSVTSKSQAAAWNIADKNEEITGIELIKASAPYAGTARPAEDAKEYENVYIAMSDRQFGQLWLVDNNGQPLPGTYNPNELGTLYTSWGLTTAETYYDAAVEAGEKKINALIDDNNSAIWNNKTQIEAAKKAVNDAKAYPSTLGSGNITGAISSATAALDRAYTNLYNSATNQVVTLAASANGFLQVADSEINNNGSGSDVASFWTMRRSGSGYTFENQFLGVYLAYIPAKDTNYDQWGNPIEGYPAHFGVASTGSVFTLTPGDNGFVLSYNDINFGVDESVNDTEIEYTLKPVTKDEAIEAVRADDGEFEKAKSYAASFLDALSDMAGEGWSSVDKWGESDENIFDYYAEKVSALAVKLPDGENTTAIDVLKAARSQMSSIVAAVNEASTPMFITAGSKYVSSSTEPYEGYNNGRPVTYQVPRLRAVDVDATAKGERLATALWAFEYVGEGKAYFFNTEDLYLTARHFNDKDGQESYVTTTPSDASLLSLVNGQFVYADGEVTVAVSDQESVSTFAIANAMLQPEAAADVTVDNDGVVSPASGTKYYRIASVGGGGVIGAILPGDNLTHSATSLGSYWWLEQDKEDVNANAYYIHSIYPGYYLGADLTLSDKAAKWYIGQNSAEHATGVNNVFNGYESGLLIGNRVDVATGNVIAAAPYTSAGSPNSAIRSGCFSTSNWELSSWMFVEAEDADQIIADYVDNDLAWQKLAVMDAFDQISKELPFPTNTLSAAISEIYAFTADNDIKSVLEFNEILAWAQEAFDEEVLRNAPGRCVNLINTGRQYEDNAPEAYLAGSGSSLRFVSILDSNEDDARWNIIANGTKGISFGNLNRRMLGAPSANGSVSSSAGTYRLALNVWWQNYDSEGNPTSTSPWYAVPAAVKESGSADEGGADNEKYLLSMNYGIGLENVNAPGMGLAAVGGSSNSLCGADLVSPYAQWKLSLSAPTGIEGVDDDAAAAEEVELYNIQGIRVNRADAAPGIYLSRRSDGSVVKVIIR